MSLKMIVARLLLVGLIYGLLSGLPALAQDQTVDLSQVTPTLLDESHFADLDTYINDALLRLGGSGAAVAIVQNGEIIYSKGFGVTELNGSIPVSGDTQFMIGSGVKSMTALMIGTLVEEGVLKWDTPISEVLPSFALSDPAATASVTFRDLLSMRSGLQSFHAPILLTSMSPEQIIESLAQIPLTAPPGEMYNYSNQGYASAGFIGAIAAGGDYGDNLYETYVQLVQDRVLNPIGMDRTTFDFSAPIATQNRAAPIGPDMFAGGFDVIPFELERSSFSTTPSGGGWSTAEDLAKYVVMQMNGGVTSDGTRIISEALLEETWLPLIDQGDGTSFGLGWTVTEFHGLQSLEYNGNNLGYSTRLQFLPEVNMGVVAVTNRGLSVMGRAVGNYVYELAFGLDHTTDAIATEYNNQITGGLAQITNMLQTEMDNEMVAPYLGQYEQGIAVRWNEAGDLVLATPYGEIPIRAVEGQTGFFLIRSVGILAAQFTENTEGLMTLTFVGTLDASQPPFVLMRID
jgi:CubicO group peptidase (beta-lactamase class C family)